MKKIFFLMPLVIAAVWVGTDRFVPNRQKGDIGRLSFCKRYTYPLEQHNVYDFSTRNQLRFDVADSTKDTATSIDGRLNVRFIRRNRNGTALAILQFSHLTLHLEDPAVEQVLKHIYSRPFITVFTPEGRILHSYFKGRDSDSAGIEELLDAIQIVLRNQPRYRILEQTRDGNVSASYLRIANRVRKRREGYYQSDRRKSDKVIIRSEINATVDCDWIETLHLREKVAIYTDKKKVIESRYVVSLKKSDVSADPTLEVWRFNGDIDYLVEQFRHDENISYLEEYSQKAAKRYIEKEGISLGSLLMSVRPDDPNSLARLAGYLKLYPKTADQLLPVIKDAGNELAAALISVLQRAGTPQAQQSLQTIADSDDYTEINRVRALISLGGIDHPTAQSVVFLQETSGRRETAQQRTFSNVALLSLGRIAPKQKDSSTIRRILIDTFNESVGDPSEQKTVLLSMKNAGAEQFVSEIAEALESPDYEVKAAAIKASEHMNTPEIRTKLLSMFNTEEDLLVRRRLAKALLTMEPDGALIKKAGVNALRDRDPVVRNTLIKYLYRYKKRYPENVQILKQLRRSEKDAANQRLLIEKGF